MLHCLGDNDMWCGGKSMSSGDNASMGNQNHQPLSESYLHRKSLKAEVEDVKGNVKYYR